MSFPEKVFSLLAQIPPSKVTTYAELARAAGRPKAWRWVGRILSQNSEPDKYPCYKVVKSDGTLGGYSRGLNEKMRRLEKEGIKTKNKRVDLNKHFHKFK
ncbi:MAG: hypothetical protein DRP13_02535 [Candidatus Aenigmatarchaeota archaeon]|nr:MAG: hypothetical protein DRP13_02535 [Candidatus Aenigmarchaeota archaeon]